MFTVSPLVGGCTKCAATAGVETATAGVETATAGVEKAQAGVEKHHQTTPCGLMLGDRSKLGLTFTQLR
jgi:hypothetical protein